MKNLKRYKGLVRLSSGGHYISVECDALNPSQAKKIIQSQYNIKSWAKQMSSN